MHQFHDALVSFAERRDITMKTGLLAGLWEYPNIQGLLTEEQAAAQLAAWGLRPLRWEKSWRCRHIFTHVRWEMQGYAVTVAGEGELEWYPKERRQEMAVSPFAIFPLWTPWREIVRGSAIAAISHDIPSGILISIEEGWA